MKTLSTLICLVFLSFQSIAQSNISGTISDDNGKSVFYATVALFQVEGDKYIDAVSSEEDGSFTLKNVKAGEYYVTSNMLGYQEYKSNSFTTNGSDSKSIDVQLQTDVNLLETVEITERVPLLEQKADKLVVNVENNITNINGNLLDVMRKVPGMLVVNDRLSMAGAGTPTILINGKSTQYMDVQALLKDMPGDNIKQVEIIHQPGAEYEASGSGPIINIILKKNSLFGTNGSVNVGVGYGELWDYNTGINLSHYAGKVNITGGLGYSRNANIERLYLTRRLTNINSAVNGTYNQASNEEAIPRTYRGNVRIDYDMTSKHRIGIESKYYDNAGEFTIDNTTNVDLLTGQDYILQTTNSVENGWMYRNINPYYIFEIDTSGQKLEVDANFAKFTRNSFNTLVSTRDSMNSSSSQRYDQPGVNNIFASSLDYTKPLNSVFELKLGAKYSTASLDNNAKSEFLDENNVWVNNPQQSNHYLFDEDIYAVYGKLGFATGDWSGTIGLRYEESRSVGNSLTLDSVLTRDIKKVFPSFSISKKIGALTPTVSYSYRIDRPRYSSLNPFVYYLDPFTYSVGNPTLRPELTHSAKFTLAYEGQPFFEVNYRKLNDAIVEVTSQEQNNEEAFKTDVNFDDQSTFSTSLYFPLFFIKGLDGYGGVIVTRNDLSSLYNEGNFNRAAWNTTAFIQANFTLPGDLNTEIGGWYTSPQQDGIFKAGHMYGMSMGVSKKIMNNKGKISLGVEDLFNRFFHAKVDYQQDMDVISEWQAPVFSARFSYKFGNQHLKSKAKKSSSASEEVRRAQ